MSDPVSSRDSISTRLFPPVVSIAIAVFGLPLLVGGVYLAFLGGSLYFCSIGAIFLASAYFILRRKAIGVHIFFVGLLFSAVWAYFDAGWNYWPLVSRLFAFGVLAIPVACALPLLAPAQQTRQRSIRLAGVAGLCLTVMLAAWQAFTPAQLVVAADSSESPGSQAAAAAAVHDWDHWGGDAHGSKFSAADQINLENVKKLKVAWAYRSGEIAEGGIGAENQNTPLQIGNSVYLCTPRNVVIALDADRGTERWRYDSKSSAPNWQRCRGLGYHADAAPAVISETPDTAKTCSTRIIMATIDARIIAIDAKDGKPCADFGHDGIVSLAERMGEIKPGFYTQTSAPLVADGKIVVGGRVYDNYEVGEPSGVIRAFDVHSGALLWAWDLGRQHAEGKSSSEPFTRSTPNAWSTLSYDSTLKLVYVPLGNSTPDFWGGHRSETQDEFSSSIVALNVDDGSLRWKFQTVHHDIWDYDLPAQPSLIDLPDGQGKTVPALAQVTKTGQTFLLNRETGVPLTKVEELPVPVAKDNIIGERHSSTQPFSTGMPSIGLETLRESDMWGATPIDQMLCRIQFRSSVYEGPFTPTSLEQTIQYPGVLGGMNWGSASYNPFTNQLFVNDIRVAMLMKLVPRKDVDPSKAGGPETGLQAQYGTPYGLSSAMFMSALGVPCQKPPYGTMSAINLTTRQLDWQVPMGTVQDAGPLGLKTGLPIPIGMPTLGGSVATKSGLLFFAGTMDYYLRALDVRNGKEVWKARLPVGGQAAPMTYVSPATGKQYVVVVAGGSRGSPDRGDHVVAYALPD